MGDELKANEAKLKKAGELAKNAVDAATTQAALDYIYGLYSPYHDMVTKWHDWFYGGNHPGVPPYMIPKSWNPDHNFEDMITQEITDAQKQLGYIRNLEAKLKNKKPGEGNELDWEMLSRMKKDLGMKVDYKTATEQREEQRAKAAGWDWEQYKKDQEAKEAALKAGLKA